MCPFQSLTARKLWGKACNYHKGTDKGWNCGNPAACERRLNEAAREEQNWIKFVEEWA